LQRFLDLAGWFRQFIKGYASITVNLFDGLKGNKLEWTKERENVFVNMKEQLKKQKI
jgi:hypothetical protein